MASIPGMRPGWIPSADPVIHMTFGDSNGKLETDDWGSDFEIEGNLEPIAVAIVDHVLSICDGSTLGYSFSRFNFQFEKGTIKVKSNERYASDPTMQELIRKIYQVLKLKAFL